MLFNKTTKRKVIGRIVLAQTPWQRLKGLMFEKPERFKYGLVFALPRESRSAATIHMFFVFFPIDVVFLNKGKRVVDIVRKLQPFTPSYTPKKPAKYLIELPEGKSRGVKEGHVLEWQDSIKGKPCKKGVPARAMS